MSLATHNAKDQDQVSSGLARMVSVQINSSCFPRDAMTARGTPLLGITGA